MTLLKLKAEDAEDLETIAVLLQDSVVPISEMAFKREEQRFAMVANRFRWETTDGGHVEGQIYERVHCGVRFEEVKSVQVQNFDQKRRDKILSLLTIGTGDGVIDLMFAAGGVVRLEVNRIACRLEDFDRPWPTQWRPAHPEETGDG